MLHESMGLDSTTYDFEVFRITTEITKQVFPIALDTDHPDFRAGLQRLFDIDVDMEAAKARGGLVGKLQQGWHAVRAFGTFARLYFMPVIEQEVSTEVRLAPRW